MQEIIDDKEIPEEHRPSVTPEIQGTATWGNGLLRCSCCTGKTNRSKQQQQLQQQMDGDWAEHDAADPWGDKVESAAAAATGEAQQGDDNVPQQQQQQQQQQDSSTQQQQQQQKLWGECCSCCERLVMGGAADSLAQPCSKPTWEEVVEDLKLMDRITGRMRERRFTVRFRGLGFRV